MQKLPGPVRPRLVHIGFESPEGGDTIVTAPICTASPGLPIVMDAVRRLKPNGIFCIGPPALQFGNRPSNDSFESGGFDPMAFN